MNWMKKGEEYLPKYTIKKLRELYQKEKNAKAKLRLLAAILRKEEKSLDDISDSVHTPKTTVHDWLKRLEHKGLEGLVDDKQSGRPSWLSSEQKKELKNVLSESPEKQDIPFKVWTTPLVQYIIYKLFNVKYKQRNVNKIAKKLGFTIKIARSKNKKASTKAQEEFKKKLKKKHNIILNTDIKFSYWMKPTS